MIAEKGANSTWNRTPIQYEYRQNVPHTVIDGEFETLAQDARANAEDPYIRAAMRFSGSKRPLLLRPAERVDLPHELLQYAPEIPYCGSLQPLRDS